MKFILAFLSRKPKPEPKVIYVTTIMCANQSIKMGEIK